MKVKYLKKNLKLEFIRKSAFCGCGNLLKYGYDSETNCNYPCGGNSYEICGGYFYFSVYLTGIYLQFLEFKRNQRTYSVSEITLRRVE